MRNFMKQLWLDEGGFVISSELIFVATLLVIGMVTGWTTIRDQVLGELGDVADAVSEVNQTYSYSAITGHTSNVAGTAFDDESDFCETPGASSDQVAGSLPQCLGIVGGTSEQ